MTKLIAGIDDIGTETQKSEGWCFFCIPETEYGRFSEEVKTLLLKANLKVFHGKKFRNEDKDTYEQFNPNNPKAGLNNYILFGGEKEQFIIHQITNKPDFDQIIEVKATLNIPANQKYSLFSIQNAENKPIGISGNIITVSINNNQQNIMLLKQIYLEFDDLKE